MIWRLSSPGTDPVLSRAGVADSVSARHRTERALASAPECPPAAGDFGAGALCRVLLGLIVVGGRRLRHLGLFEGDPLFARFCALKDLPTDHRFIRWLKRFAAPAVEA